MDITKLKFWDKNPRSIKIENLDKLKRSLQDDPEFLSKRKILVNETKDWMIVYAGNQRLRWLIELWYKDVPDEWVDIEKDIPTKLMEKRAFKDNVEYGGWDKDKLNDNFTLEELEELDLPEWELDLSDMNDIELDEANEDSVPEPQKEAKLVKVGDIFQLGNHRIMCGDSTVKEDVDKLMDGKKADMVFTDPPYWVKIKNANWSILWDEDLDVFEWCLINLKEYSKEDSHKYIYFGVQYIKESIFALSNYFKQNNIIVNRITHENKPSPSWYFKSNYELCYFSNEWWIWFNEWYWNVSETTLNDSRYKWDWKIKTYPALLDNIKATEHNLKSVHPTQKTVEICEFYQNISSNKDDIVLDLFLWSWSTLIACEKTNRTCYWMELDPVYIEVILKRYHDYTKGNKEIKCLNRDLDINPILNG